MELLGEKVGDLGSFRLGGNTNSSALTSHCSPVPQHPLAAGVLAITCHRLHQSTSGAGKLPLSNNRDPALGIPARPKAGCDDRRGRKSDSSQCCGLCFSQSRLPEGRGFPGHLQPRDGGVLRQH